MTFLLYIVGPNACYDDPTSSKLFLDPGALHTAIMQPLAFAPGTRVYYTFGDSTGNHPSPVYSFVAPRAPAAPSAFTFMVTADMGIGGIEEGQAGGATDNDPPLNGADQVIAAILSDPGTSEGGER